MDTQSSDAPSLAAGSADDIRALGWAVAVHRAARPRKRFAHVHAR